VLYSVGKSLTSFAIAKILGLLQGSSERYRSPFLFSANHQPPACGNYEWRSYEGIFEQEIYYMKFHSDMNIFRL
jgi:hypothetical protein